MYYDTNLLISLGIFGLIYVGYQKFKERQQFLIFPAVGRSGILTSYLDAFRFINHAQEMVQEGYDKHYPAIFRLPSWTGWMLVLTGEKHVDELRRAPEEVLSSHEAQAELFAARYIFGKDELTNLYHLELIRSHFNRTLGSIYPVVRDEIAFSFQELIPATDDWTVYNKIPGVINQTISRATNRIFIGRVSREPEFIQCTLDLVKTVFISSQMINLFPAFLKPFASRLFNAEKTIQVGIKYLAPLVEERLRMHKKLGDNYPNKPEDMLTWLIEAAPPESRTVRNVGIRLLLLNLVAVHTTGAHFTLILLELVKRPEYIEPLREEIEIAINLHGWENDTFKKMPKLDSFMRECLRITRAIPYTMFRLASQDFVFSDGVKIPKGAYINVAHIPRHLDENAYPNPNTFDGYRFSKLDDIERIKNQVISSNPNFMVFGYGRTTCPGRFMAVTTMKTMMAELLLNYDIEAGRSPKHKYFKGFLVIDEGAEILLRRRKGTSSC